MRRPGERGAREPVRVVFRYDDCSAKTSLELEQRLVEAFARCGAQLSLAVIPFVCEGSFRDPSPQRTRALSSAKATWLRNAAADGHAEIVLHGYSHQTTSVPAYTEFAGRELKEQWTRIIEGKHELEHRLGAPVTTFVPPWNSYDQSTVTALEEAGFACLSASVRGPFPPTTSLAVLPASCWFDAVMPAVKVARRFPRSRPVLVVMLHDYDFLESGSPQAWLGVDDFARRLEAVRRQPAVKLCSLRQACEDQALASSGAWPAHRRWWLAAQRLPWRYRHVLEDQVLSGNGRAQASASIWLRQACVSTYLLWNDVMPSVKRRIARYRAR
jgi:predicted deacetylase